jgi:hypothetical protein
MLSLYERACEELGEANVTIERIDVNGDYESSNCTFIHISEQQNNTQRNRPFIAINQISGLILEFKNQTKFAKLINVAQSTVNGCLMGRRKTVKKGEWKLEFLDITKD